MHNLFLLQIQNILIIQAPNGSTQLIIPNNIGPIMTQPNIVLPPNNIAPTIIQPAITPTTAFLPVNNQPLVLNMMDEAAPSTTIQTSGAQSVSCVSSIGTTSALAVVPLSNESVGAAVTTTAEAGVANQWNSTAATPLMAVETAEGAGAAIMAPHTEQDNDIHCEDNDPLQDQNTECPNGVRPPLERNEGGEKEQENDGIAEGSDDESLPDLIGEDNMQADLETLSDTSKSSNVENRFCPDRQDSKIITSTLKTTLATPLKVTPTNTNDIATPLLHMPSLLATPQKIDEKGPTAVCVSFSPLKTPVISIPTPDKSLSTPEKALAEIMTPAFILDGQMQSKSHVKSLDSSLSDSNSVISSVENISVAISTQFECSDVSPTKNIVNTCSENLEIQKLENQNKNEKEPKSANSTPTKANSITLVTSVYQSPILSSEVQEAAGPITVMNHTPKKSKPPLRRISPAKILRSPMKTSPMKQVSPILRKYHRYSPKKRRSLPSSKKLSPILPKIVSSKRMGYENIHSIGLVRFSKFNLFINTKIGITFES